MQDVRSPSLLGRELGRNVMAQEGLSMDTCTERGEVRGRVDQH